MTIWSSEIRELEKLRHSVKESHPRLEKELSKLMKTDDENIVLVYARRCLEIIISELCECELNRPRGSEPLKGIIDKLNREGKVPPHIIGSINNINSISTFGAHPKEFDPEQVKPVLLDLTTTLRWYINYYESRSGDETIIHKNDQRNTQKSIPKKSRSSRRRIAQISAAAAGISIVVVSIFFIINPWSKQPAADESLAKSIAVLPFHNLSGDLEQEYICDGLTDEIISHLYKIESFDEVRSFTSIMNYRDSERNIPLIAEELNVNYILEGTFKRIGDEMRVTAQLIEPKSDNHIWLKDYDLPYEEVIGIPAEIALQIADHLNAFISKEEQQRITKIPTSNQEAYELFQQINSSFIRREYLSFINLEEMLFKVIELDPEYADAYAWLGFSALLGVSYGADFAGTSKLSVYDALSYVNKALDLDPDNAVAYGILGLYNLWIRWDYPEAEKYMLKASKLEPNNVLLKLGFANFYLAMERMEGLKPIINGIADESELVMGYYAKLMNHQGFQESRKRYYDYAGDLGLPVTGEYYVWLEEFDSARSCFEKAIRLGNQEMSSARFKASQALAYYHTGDSMIARGIINELIAGSEQSLPGSNEFFLGLYYSGIEDTDSAFFWLEKAYNLHSAEMYWLRVNPLLENIRDDPRYWDLYKRTGHKAYDNYLVSNKG